jgi:membrane dipeptidase
MSATTPRNICSAPRCAWLAAAAAATLALGGGCTRNEPAAAAGAAAQAPVAGAATTAAVITLDTHSDIPLDFATDGVDPLDAMLQNSLGKMTSGGLDAAFFIVYVGQTERTAANYAQARADALTKFDAIHRMADVLHPDLVEIAYRADDVARIAASGKLVAAIGIENGYVLGKDLELLDRDYELGARYVTLVHNGDNDLARSAQPKPEFGDGTADTGVTALGAQAIERMNRLGIMVDVSHGSKQTALDAMRLSRAPVIASHSAVGGVAVHARNMDDETLLALRADGGVIQIVAFDSYLKRQPDEQAAALRALRDSVGLTAAAGAGGLAALTPELRAKYDAGVQDVQTRWPPASVHDLVDHIDYAVRLIGVDHVGISSDFGGGGGIVGWQDASETRNVTAELEARGYTAADIAKIWSGNLLRVWHEAERVAADVTAGR